MATIDGYPAADGTYGPCQYGADCTNDMSELACPNAGDICIDHCGENH